MHLSLAPDVCLHPEFTIKTHTSIQFLVLNTSIPCVENVSLYFNLVFLSDEKGFPKTEVAYNSPVPYLRDLPWLTPSHHSRKPAMRHT